MRPTPDFKHGRQLTPVRVLLLEDDQAFAGLVRANLERVDWADLSIEHAPTMREALARLERGGIDIVITDLNLPDSKGLDTVDSLVRATDRLILVLTGERDAGLRQAVLAQGAHGIMSQDLLLRRVDSKGEACYLNISGRPMFDAHGTFCGYRGAAKDVTRRVQMDMRLAIEHAVTRLLAQSGSIAEAAPRIIQAICDTLGGACGARWEHDRASQAMVCQGSG